MIKTKSKKLKNICLTPLTTTMGFCYYMATETKTRQKMVRKKDIKELNEKIDAISGTIIRKATAYDRDHDFLKEITVNVEKCNVFFDEKSLRYAIKIEYGISPTVIYVDENGETSFNPKLKALNELKLIPIDQLNKIINTIERAKKMNQEG